MSPISLRRRLQIHFVLIAEVIGYALSLFIIAGAIAMAFINVDVTVNVSGKLQPDSTPIRLEQRAIAIMQQSTPGSDVRRGQQLAQLIESPAEFGRTLAASKLRMLLPALRDDPSTGARNLVTASEQLMRETQASQSARNLAAPADGFWITTHTTELESILAAGSEIGRLYSLGFLRFSGSVEAKDAAKINIGMPVTCKLGSGQTLAGKVTSRQQQNTAFKIEAEFRIVPEEVKQFWRERLQSPADSWTLDQVAAIRVAQQSLFSKLVLRK